MKHLILSLAIVFCSTITTAEEPEKPFAAPTQIVFQNGTTLHNVSIIRWEKDRVIVKHRGGVGPAIFRYIKAPNADTLAKWRAATEATVNAENAEKQAALAARRKIAERDAAARERKIIFEKAIRERKIMVGMTPEQVTQSWGKPTRKNISDGAYGRREQWVYHSAWLYFEEGLLTSWQVQRD